MIWDSLISKGGSWKIRSLIKSILKDSFPKEYTISDYRASSMYFSLMKEEYDNSNNKKTSFVLIFDFMNDFIDGKIKDSDLLKFSRSVLNDIKSNSKISSSVRIQNLNGDPLSSSKKETNPKKWRTVYKTTTFALYTIVILFLIHILSTNISKDTKDDLIDSVLNYINRYVSTGEEVIELPPSFIQKHGKLLQSTMKTPYISSLDTRLRIDHMTRNSVAHEYRIKDADYLMKDTSKLVSGENYELFKKGFVSDSTVKELNLWVDYMVKIVNPIYAPIDSVRVILSKKYVPKRTISEISDSVLGEYMTNQDIVFVKTGYEKEYNMDIVSTLIHEMAHRAHLESREIALQCRRAYAGKIIEDSNAPGICHTSGTSIDSASTREYLNIISDTVEAVIYLGIPNDSMSYEEALVYKKMIMDMRIHVCFEDAKSGTVYKKYWSSLNKLGSYGMIDYYEFWAEASTSYLYTVHEERFPSRKWIQENDPKLYDLLEEMYSSAPVYDPY